VASSTGGSSWTSACTHSAAPGPVVPVPIRTRSVPRTTAARSPPGSRPIWVITPSVPTFAYLPSRRGTSSTFDPVSPACAASTAARISASASLTGTTMPGSTTTSSSGSTGSASVSLTSSSKVESYWLNQLERGSVPERMFADGDRCSDGAWNRQPAHSRRRPCYKKGIPTSGVAHV
jgi:hypothetical protein